MAMKGSMLMLVDEKEDKSQKSALRYLGGRWKSGRGGSRTKRDEPFLSAVILQGQLSLCASNSSLRILSFSFSATVGAQQTNDDQLPSFSSSSTRAVDSHHSPVAGFNPFMSLTTQADLHSPQTSLSLPLFSHPFSAASRAEKAEEVKAGRVKVLRREVRDSGEKGRKVVGLEGGGGMLRRGRRRVVS